VETFSQKVSGYDITAGLLLLLFFFFFFFFLCLGAGWQQIKKGGLWLCWGILSNQIYDNSGGCARRNSALEPL